MKCYLHPKERKKEEKDFKKREAASLKGRRK
jgi:hypothetical protein